MKPNPPNPRRPRLAGFVPTKRAICTQCGSAFAAFRTSALYCSGRCRKRGQRSLTNAVPAADYRKAEAWDEYRSGLVIHVLTQLALIKKVGPWSRNDPSPQTYALMVPRRVALASVNTAIVWCDDLTDDELVRILDARKILQKTQPLPVSGTKKPPRVSQHPIRQFVPLSGQKPQQNQVSKMAKSAVEQIAEQP